MTRLLVLGAALAAGCIPPPTSTQQTTVPAHARPILVAADTERPDWRSAFAAEGGVGTFVLLDTETGTTQRLDPDRAARRYLPASTFKVYNALVALETGVVGDPDSVFVWDGVTREIPQWNRDHTLRSGMAASTVWLYQRVARAVGRDRYRAAFDRQPYGNGTVGPDVDQFWLDSSLQISADEQIPLMDGLRQGLLAFRPDVQATVRDLLPVLVDDGRGRMLAKTGWGGFGSASGTQTPLGWLVGWVERSDGAVAVFALNVEPAAAGFDMGPARLRIARAILASEGWLAPEPGGRP